MITKVRQSIRKNLPDLQALVRRRFPRFVYSREVDASINEIPVFVFHEIDRSGFEEKLIYLSENGYSTLDADALVECLGDAGLNDGKKIAMTFDDGHISLFRVAYPLLQKYGCRAISFICPGLVSSVDHNSAERDLCSWEEIEEMHRSGLVDFQLHSLNHDLVFNSSRVVDFFHPGLTSPWFGRQDIPYLCGDGPNYSLSNIHPHAAGATGEMDGFPIFEHVPRYSAVERFEPSAHALEECTALVRENGGIRFFDRERWRAKLADRYKRASEAARGRTISGKAYEGELKTEFEASRALMEQRLTGKRVEHLCYPWYEGTPMSDRVAGDCGYRTVYYGLDKVRDRWDGGRYPVPIGRLSDEYFFTLPGVGKRSLLSVFFGKFLGR